MNPVQRLAPKHFKRIPTTFDRLMHVQVVERTKRPRAESYCTH